MADGAATYTFLEESGALQKLSQMLLGGDDLLSGLVAPAIFKFWGKVADVKVSIQRIVVGMGMFARYFITWYYQSCTLCWGKVQYLVSEIEIVLVLCHFDEMTCYRAWFCQRSSSFGERWRMSSLVSSGLYSKFVRYFITWDCHFFLLREGTAFWSWIGYRFGIVSLGEMMCYRACYSQRSSSFGARWRSSRLVLYSEWEYLVGILSLGVLPILHGLVREDAAICN